MGTQIFSFARSYYYQEQYQSPKFWVDQQMRNNAYVLGLFLMYEMSAREGYMGSIYTFH